MKAPSETKNEPGFIDVLKSVMASFFGVQSEANRRRDFTYGKPSHYIVVGLVLTLGFVLAIWGITLLMLHFAGV